MSQTECVYLYVYKFLVNTKAKKMHFAYKEIVRFKGKWDCERMDAKEEY